MAQQKVVRVRELKRAFSSISNPTDRVKAVVAHVLSDLPDTFDVWVDKHVVVITPVGEGRRYIGDVVRQIAWWLKELGYFILVRFNGDQARIEYLRFS